MERFDCVIAGGGILGTALSYWLSQRIDGKVAVVEMEQNVARHTSGRNTGVIHRPFYLNPQRRKVFAKCAQASYGLWKSYAREKGLPWAEVRTIEVATKPEEVKIIEKYLHWALENGMKEEEVELLTPAAVKKLEPKVECAGAIYSKTDTSVDYRLFTEFLKKDSAALGARFLFGFKLKRAETKAGGLELVSETGDRIEAGFLINCAGGNAVDLAHAMGVGREYTDLHFRGEYWEIAAEPAKTVNHNIYSVPRHPELPFLDPHWIVRADGRREIGPNAVLVTGCKTYEGFYSNLGELAGKIFEKPLRNKLSLFVNRDFLRLASEEWISSISKGAMLKRVRKFIPDLKLSDLARRGTAGIRSSVIDAQGNFMKEAIELDGPRSFHILNYNSPGATGSPAYTALLAEKLIGKARFKARKNPPAGLWDYQALLGQLS